VDPHRFGQTLNSGPKSLLAWLCKCVSRAGIDDDKRQTVIDATMPMPGVPITARSTSFVAPSRKRILLRCRLIPAKKPASVGIEPNPAPVAAPTVVFGDPTRGIPAPMHDSEELPDDVPVADAVEQTRLVSEPVVDEEAVAEPTGEVPLEASPPDWQEQTETVDLDPDEERPE
jgi:hypothetical protein